MCGEKCVCWAYVFFPWTIRIALDQGEVWGLIWAPKRFQSQQQKPSISISFTQLASLFYLCLQAKSAESKKAKKDKPADGDSDEEEVLDDLIEGDSEIESDEYDVPYDGEEDDIECDGKSNARNSQKRQPETKTNLSQTTDDDDDNDDGSGSDDQA